MAIYTKKVTVGGAYAKKKAYEYEGKKFDADIKDGDIIKVISQGTAVPGVYGDQHVFKIRTRNGDKNFAFNQTTINNLIDAYGEDDKNWMDKDVKVWVIKAMVSGKMSLVAYLSHPDAEMDDEGRFKNPHTKEQGEDVDAVEYPEDEINPDDIPF